MRAVWKFPFPVQDEIELMMPLGANVIAVQAQYKAPCLWADVDTEAPLVPRRFRVFGTGHEIPRIYMGESMVQQSTYVHRGTFQILDGRFVGHLFEEQRF